MNLIIAVVLDGFSSVQQFDTLKVFENNMMELTRRWWEKDPEHTGYLPVEEVVPLMLDIPEPVGFAGVSRRHAMHQMRYFHLYNGRKLHFSEVAVLCARRSYLYMGGFLEKDLETV